MARIFITGSADGLGLLASQSLIAQGHQIVLHARNAARAEQALRKTTGAITTSTADLFNINETKKHGGLFGNRWHYRYSFYHEEKYSLPLAIRNDQLA